MLAADPSPGRVLWPLVPGLVFVALIGTVLATRWQAPLTPVEEARAALDETNPGTRAQLLAALQKKLRNDENVAMDPDLALEVLGRLDRLDGRWTPREEALARRLPGLSPEAAERERAVLAGDRDYYADLVATLSASLVPVGLPLLRELAEGQPAIEPVALAHRRRGAVNGLATLGESLQRWRKLPPDDLEALARFLVNETGSGRVGEGLRAAAGYLGSLRAGRPDLAGLERTIAACAADKDPVLREGAAYCARYWSGTAAQDEAIDKTLLALLDDDGRGQELRALRPTGGKEPRDGARDVEAQPGFLVRAHAATALAWRGSPNVQVDRLRDLLDVEHLKAMLVVETADGKRQPNEPRILDLVQGALQATVQLHQKSPRTDISSLRAAVERLASHRLPAVRQPAAAAKAALEGKAEP